MEFALRANSQSNCRIAAITQTPEAKSRSDFATQFPDSNKSTPFPQCLPPFFGNVKLLPSLHLW
jgi:hypothetical protein